MIDMTKLRALQDTATKGPWLVDDAHPGPLTNDGSVASIGISSQARWDAAYERDPDDTDAADDASWIAGIWGPLTAEDMANAHLMSLAPELNAAVLAHPEALRVAMISGYSIGFATGQKTDKSYWVSLDPARNPALQAALKEIE